MISATSSSKLLPSETISAPSTSFAQLDSSSCGLISSTLSTLMVVAAAAFAITAKPCVRASGTVAAIAITLLNTFFIAHFPLFIQFFVAVQVDAQT